MDHGERRSSSAHEAALRAVHRPAAKPWRGGGVAAGGAQPPPPPKVYRVAPRDFRELVQRLTGAGGTPAPGPALAAQQRVAQAVVAETRSAEAAAEQFDYAAWFSAPLLSPAYGAAGFDGHHGSGALL